MRDVISAILKRPYISIVIILLITTFGLLNLKKLNIDTSERSLIIQNDPDLDYYDETIQQFVSDNIEMIYIEDENLFSSEKLSKIENLISELTLIEGITKTESLFNVTNFKNEDDFLSLDPFIDFVPDEQEEIDTVKSDAINNPIVSGNLVSKDGKKFIVKLFLNDEESKNEKMFDINVVNNIENVIKNYKNDFKDIFQTGNPFVKKTLYDTIKRDRNTLFPISVLILFFMLMLTIRSLHGAILPLITSSISVIAAVGFMSLVNIPLNLLTFIIPSLIIVIGSTEDVHILSEYFEGIKLKRDREKAVIYLGKKVGVAIFITALTTFLGFMSIAANNILVLRQFGLAAAFGLFINPVVTILFSPVYLRYFGPKSSSKNKKSRSKFSEYNNKISDSISNFILSHKKSVVGIFILITLISVFFTFRVKLEYDLIQNFKKDSIAFKSIDKYQKNISGINTLFLRIKGNQEETFLAPYYLNKIDRLKTELEKIEGVDKVITITDYIKLVNKGMNPGSQDEYKIPFLRDLISQYFLLMDPVEIQRYITNDYNEVNIIIQHGISSSNELEKLLDKINNVIEVKAKNIGEYKLTGFQLLTKKASHSIALGTVQGIILLSIIIFIIMSILFVNIKAGFISLFSNILPVFFTFGLMGFFKIPLNTGTCMVAVIALGLAVDDTIHLMSKYKIDMREMQDPHKGITASIKSELRPVFSTSASLASLFFALCISDLVNIKYFGFLSGMVIIYAFLCDIFLTTTLLSTTQLITIFDILSLKVKKVILSSKLLNGLKPRQVKELLLLGAIREAKKGDYIIHENDIGNTMNIILEGSVQVSIHDKKKNRDVFFTDLKEGDIMGELAVLFQMKRNADIIAKTDIKYFELDNHGLKRIERLRPKIAGKLYYNISNILGERLLKLNQKYIQDTR